MNKINHILFCASFFIMCTFSSCTDYLNVSDELAGELDLTQVFENSSLTRRFHRNIYSGIPDMSFISLNASYAAISGLGNPWPSVSDELKGAQNNVKSIPVTGYHAGDASLGRWELYKQIRQANIFLETATVIPQSGDTDFIDETELTQLKNEARFLRAYYHYLLFELYGPIVIMESAADPSSSDLDYARNSVDEIIEFLDKEFTAMATLLNETEPEDRRAVPTKGVALALKAKLWVYAASPLFNGGYDKAVALKDNTGKSLFPAKDPKKWDKALSALQEFINYSNGHYKLHEEFDEAGSYDANSSLYQLFQRDNKEIIWASTNNSWGGVDGEGTDRRMTPRSEYQGFACVGITQELIDDFFMSDGFEIEKSKLYNEDGFSEFGPEKDLIYNMYINREPRFYQAVVFQGRRWQVSNRQIFYHKGSGNDNTKADNPYTGALLYKRMNNTLLNQGSNPKSRFRPVILFRLAEFYLLYAEALNEVNPSDPRIIQYVDMIRERAGIPKLVQIKPEIIGNKDLQRKAIQRESRVELCTEGQRYFDVRRWLLAEDKDNRQGGDFHGMNMNAEESKFHERTAFETRVFEPKMYLYPLPLDEVQKSLKLVQNPEW